MVFLNNTEYDCILVAKNQKYFCSMIILPYPVLLDNFNERLS